MIFSSEKESKNFSNCVTEFHVEQGAHLSVTKIQIESGQDIHLSKEKLFQHRDSNFTLNTVTLNGLFVRNEVEVAVEGVNAETNLNGVYVANQQQFVDNHTTIDHKVAHCLSNELYKGVLFDKATGVFNGKVFVRKDAQKINAFQSNANILMSQDASVNAKPELEIYADDVKCSHGSTTGQLDEEAVFYLRSRGLSDKAARNLLVSAFVGQVLEKIENTEILDFVYGKLNERFGWEY
jgi:Fe-S cluster assembly protein SufD